MGGEKADKSKELAVPKRGRGRPKGSKNSLTLLREEARRKYVDAAADLWYQDVEKVAKAVLKQALEGCLPSQKMIMDRMLPSQKATEGFEGAGGGDKQITIVIQTNEPVQPKIIEGEHIEG